MDILPVFYPFLIDLPFFLVLPLYLHFLLLILLHFQDSVIHFDKQVGELRVDFVYQVREVSRGFVIDRLKEHYGRKILAKVLGVLLRNFPLKNFHNLFIFGIFNFFCEIDHFVFEVKQPLDIFALFAGLYRVN